MHHFRWILRFLLEEKKIYKTETPRNRLKLLMLLSKCVILILSEMIRLKMVFSLFSRRVLDKPN